MIHFSIEETSAQACVLISASNALDPDISQKLKQFTDLLEGEKEIMFDILERDHDGLWLTLLNQAKRLRPQQKIRVELHDDATRQIVDLTFQSDSITVNCK
ncbi:MAG: hypothetical protein EOM12_08080 [Verrucomicrobiae bacterium]|nr:hypothetical protein [Verrucomicrobiae bacterium]